MTRTRIRLDFSSNDKFDKTMYFFSINDNVHNHNIRTLYSLRHPVAGSLATKSMNGNGNEDLSGEELDIEL